MMPGAAKHDSTELVTHETVAHVVAVMRMVGVKSLWPKFNPDKDILATPFPMPDPAAFQGEP